MFLFPNHQERFNQFIEMDETHPSDLERRAMFYVISGCRDLAERVGFIYSCEERSICPEVFEEIDLTSGIRALLELAFNLYNSYPSRSIVELFGCLDDKNRDLAIEAVKIRFWMERR